MYGKLLLIESNVYNIYVSTFLNFSNYTVSEFGVFFIIKYKKPHLITEEEETEL